MRWILHRHQGGGWLVDLSFFSLYLPSQEPRISYSCLFFLWGNQMNGRTYLNLCFQLDDRWKGCTGHTWKVSKGDFMMLWWMVRDTRVPNGSCPFVWHRYQRRCHSCSCQRSQEASHIWWDTVLTCAGAGERLTTSLCWEFYLFLYPDKCRAFQNVMRTPWKGKKGTWAPLSYESQSLFPSRSRIFKRIYWFSGTEPAELVYNCIYGGQHWTIIAIPFYAVHDLQEYLGRSQAC